MALSKRQRRDLRKKGIIDINEQSANVPQKGMKLKNVTPKTYAQQSVFDSYNAGNHLLLHGMAGTGKTFLSMYLALGEIFNSTDSCYNDVTIVRSVVPSRDIGFLPGKEKEKIGVYEDPYKAIVNELFTRGDGYDILKHKHLVNFVCTSFIRGTTLNNTIVIVDEIQNMGISELDTIMTRIGHNCKVIFCGDFRQTDLHSKYDKSGISEFMRILDEIPEFDHIEFHASDIVRSTLVKNYIIAREELRVCA